MPTGYTAAVVDGKITEFKDFAMSCARAFGALVTMRDDSMDTPIPEEFQPSTYSADRLTEARDRLRWLGTLTAEQSEQEALADYEKAVKSAQDYNARQVAEDTRLDAMAEKVAAWVPPTAQHVEMKAFMLNQITISKSGDYRSPEPAKLTGAQWLEREQEQAQKDIGYYAAEQAKEVTRARERTEWVKALRASLETSTN